MESNNTVDEDEDRSISPSFSLEQSEEAPFEFFSSEVLRRQFTAVLMEAYEQQNTKQQYILCKSTQIVQFEASSLWKATVHPYQNRIVCIFTPFEDDMNKRNGFSKQEHLHYKRKEEAAKKLYMAERRKNSMVEETMNHESHDGLPNDSSSRRSSASLEDIAEPMAMLSEAIPQLVWTTRPDGTN